jgi:hypothetical protein
MDHFVQGVLTAEDEVYLSEPDLRLANGETIRILYSDLRSRGEPREEDNPVSQLLEANQWYEMLLIAQIGLGKDKKVTYTPSLPPGTRLELKCREVQVFSEVVKHNDVLQGIILNPNWDATSVPYLAVAGQRVSTHRFVLVETAIGKIVLSYAALQQRLGEQVKALAPGGYLEWDPSRLDILAIIAKHPLKSDSDTFSSSPLRCAKTGLEGRSCPPHVAAHTIRETK